ncbi:MAG: autotransporter-associated beta strand repeat-containing protein [Roseomonas sp.]|nr:autotransporter-associated beta strand repeat-containing protein [Roseomonas sp.]
MAPTWAFSDPLGQIAGVTITGFDTNGNGYDNIRYNGVRSPPSSVDRYWDGGIIGDGGTNGLNGGSGIWNTANQNWTNPNGTPNNAWPQSGTAIFSGSSGSIVDVVDIQSFGGLTFLTDGYLLQGGELRITPASGNSATILVEPGLTATISTRLTDGGANYGIVKTGTGTLILSGDNTYTGGTLLQEGTLGVGHNNALGTGALTMEANTTLRAELTGLSLANNVTLNGAATVDTQTYTLTLSGIIGGAGALTKTGGGTLTLTGSNSYTGNTTVSAGTLQIAGAGSLGQGNYAGNIALSGGALLYSSSVNQTLSGVISGGGSLTKDGADSTLILTGGNSYTGNTTVSAGTLQIAGAGSLGQGDYAGAIALSGGSLRYSSSVNQTLSGVISGGGSLTKHGADSTLILTGDNTYTGGTALQQGTLGVGRSNALGTGALTMEANTTLLAGADGLALGNAVTLNGAGTINTQTNTLTLNNTVSGASGALGKAGAGTLILANTTTLSSVDVQAGTLDNRGALSASAGMSLSGDNTNLLNATGASITVQSGAGTMTGGAGAQRVDNAGGISGAVNLGSGNDNYILRASGTQAGNVNGEAGNDQVQIETAANATRSLGSGAFVNFETIELNKDAPSTGGLVITSGLALDAGPSGGALTLYRGAMQLQSASSEIRAGTVTIAQNARLSGIGQVSTGSGAGEGLIVNGTIAPGNSIGTLTVAGRYTQNQNGAYEVEFRAPTPGVAPVRGVDNDLIKVSGSAVIANGAVVRLFPLSSNAEYNAALTAPSNPTPDKLRYTIIETSGGVNTGRISLLGFSGAATEVVGNDLQLVLSTGGGGSGILVNQAPSQLGLVLPQDPLFGCRGAMLGRSGGGFNELLNEDGCSWAEAFTLRGGIKGVSGEGSSPYSITGANYTTSGVAFGQDWALNGQMALGGSFTYGNTDATFSGDTGSQMVQGFHGTLYWAYDDRLWQGGIDAGYSYYDVDSRRDTGLASSPRANASYNMQQYRLGGVVRRVTEVAENWWLLPEARLSWEPLSRDAFTETGGGDANFTSQSSDWDIAKAGVGMTLRHKFANRPAWMAEVGLGWQTLLGDTSRAYQ